MYNSSICGYILFFISISFFIISIYAIIISKKLSYTGNIYLDAIKDDEYYCYLLPLLIPITIIAVYLNWLGLKFFKHN